jgi:hypothetical protein
MIETSGTELYPHKNIIKDTGLALKESAHMGLFLHGLALLYLLYPINP